MNALVLSLVRSVLELCASLDDEYDWNTKNSLLKEQTLEQRHIEVQHGMHLFQTWSYVVSRNDEVGQVLEHLLGTTLDMIVYLEQHIECESEGGGKRERN